jgi:hypothetical protein
MKKLILLYSIIFLNLSNFYSQTGLYFPYTGTGYAIVNHNPVFNIGTGVFTIEAWVLINPNGFGDHTIFSNDQLSGGPGVQFLYVNDSQFPHLKLRTNTGIIVANTPNLADGICHHVAVVKTNNNIEIYLDGSLIYLHSGGGGLFDINNSNDIYIGAQNYAGFLHDFFYGSIRDLRFWSVARTQTEIQQNMYILSGTTGLLGSFAPGIESAIWPATYSTDCQSCAPLSSPVTITANGPTTFCQGNSVILSSNAPTGLDYAWRTTNVSTPILGTASSLNVTASGEYFLFVTNSCGTVVSNSIYVNVTGQAPTASITASGPTTFCMGNSVTLNANTGTGLSYQWQKNGNNISGATATSYSASSTGNYSVIVSNTCGNSSSNVISVNVDSVTVYLTYLGHFPCPGQCNGSLFVLDSMTTGIPPFTYSFSGAGTISTSPGQTSIAGLCPYDYVSVTVTDSIGCTASDLRMVEPVPTQTPTITITPACNLNNGTITVTGLIGAGWNCDAMRIRDDNYNLITNGTTGNPISLPAGNYILETYCSGWWLATGPCPQYFPFIIPGGITPASITALGSTSLCNGSTVTLNANTGTGLTYQWQLNNNNITGATSSSYTAGIAGDYAVVVTDSCGSNTSNTITVTVGSAPNAIITASGSTSICAGNSVTLNANTGSDLNYQWQLNGSNISGATFSAYSATSAGNYSAIISNICGSSSSNVISVTVTSSPSASITASGSTSICAGNSVTLNANTGSGLSYQWQLNGSNLNGATLSTYDATSAGNYSVVVSNTCGSSTSNVISVTTGAAPSAAITATGPTTFCAGGSVTLTANTGTGFTYQWQLNGSNISGATSSTYDAGTSGNYSVIVSDSCGNSISNIITVDVISAPGSAGAITGPTSFCRHTTQTFAVSPVPGATNYVWAVPHQAQIISGQGTNSVIVSFKVKQGDITVKPANQCGSGSLSVLPVQVIKCFHANNAVMRTTITETEISIYPNPSQNEFNCIITGEEGQMFSLSVFDYAGRMVELHENIISNKNFTFGNNLAPGFYFVEISSEEDKEIFKIVKVE